MQVDVTDRKTCWLKSWAGEERKKTRTVKPDEKKRKESPSRESGAGVGANRVKDS